MRSGAPVKSPSCAAAIRGAATRSASLGVQVEEATITARAARGVKRIWHGLGRKGARTCTAPLWASSGLVQAATPRQLLDEVADHRLGVAEQHPGVVLHVQLVVDAGKAGVLAALDGQHRLGLVRVDDRRSEEHTS